MAERAEVSANVRMGALLVAAGLAGALAGNFLSSSLALRSALGLRAGRGALLALCEDAGLYEGDVDRARADEKDRIPDPEPDHEPSLGWLAANLEVQRMARRQPLSESAIRGELDLLRFQWPQPQAWLAALRQSGLSDRSWRCLVGQDLRALSWIEARIKADLAVTPEECVTYYNTHLEAYAQPPRFRACHIFFAAPPGSSAELVQQKGAAAQAVVDRLGHGERFVDLVAHSEDEASKKRSGDLNFFSETRMPPDFWREIQALAVGRPASLIRTRLGFHIVQITDSKPAQPMPFTEARPEILAKLGNEKRSARLVLLTGELSARVRWNPSAPIRPDLPRP